jgi:hypothetical protein
MVEGRAIRGRLSGEERMRARRPNMPDGVSVEEGLLCKREKEEKEA